MKTLVKEFSGVSIKPQVLACIAALSLTPCVMYLLMHGLLVEGFLQKVAAPGRTELKSLLVRGRPVPADPVPLWDNGMPSPSNSCWSVGHRMSEVSVQAVRNQGMGIQFQ